MSGNPAGPILVVPLVILGTGVLLVLLSLPLIARRVPRNALYGVRTPLAFTSEDNWYRVNHVGGKYLLEAGLVTALTGLAGFFVPADGQQLYQLIALAFTMTAILMACVACLRIR